MIRPAPAVSLVAESSASARRARRCQSSVTTGSRSCHFSVSFMWAAIQPSASLRRFSE